MHSPASSDRRAAVELAPLARALGDAEPRFVVWKGGHELDVQGDLDCAAPRSSWGVLREAFADWGRAAGLTTVVTCDHAIGMLVLVGCCGAAGSRLLQVDLVDERLVHAIPVWTADDLLPVAIDLDGVRATRPGAEGIARLLADRRDAAGSALVAGDDEGALALARRLGLRGRLARRNTIFGRVALEGLLAARALGSPGRVVRARATDAARRSCPVLRALGAGRVVPEPLDAWLAGIRAEHEVTGVA